MSFKEITRLRKEGKLDEAYRLATDEMNKFAEIPTSLLNPGKKEKTDKELLWIKRAMAWVLHDHLKSLTFPGQFDEFLGKLHEFIALDLPNDENLAFDFVGSRIAGMVTALNRLEHLDTNKINTLFDLIRQFHFTKPSESYTFLYKAFHKCFNKWNRFATFAEWWNFENFRPEDYQGTLYEGINVMSVAEQAHIAYAKKILAQTETTTGEVIYDTPDIPRIEKFIPLLDRLIEIHPEYVYPPYFKAKLLLATGKKENALEVILPFVRKKPRDFWTWDLLAGAYPPENDMHMACLCRSVLCVIPPEFLIKVHEKLASALIIRKWFPEAKSETETCIYIRNSNNWPLTNRLKKWMSEDWFLSTISSVSMIVFLKTHAGKAEELLYSDIPETYLAVSSVNAEKEIIYFVTASKQTGYFNYRGLVTEPSMGDIYRVRLQPGHKEHQFKAFTLIHANCDTMENLIRNFSGKVYVHGTKGFGIVDNVFITPDLISKNDISNGSEISGKAILSFDKHKNTWGWKAFRMNLLC